MSDIDLIPDRPALGVADLFARTFSIYRQQFLMFFMIALPPILILQLLSVALFGDVAIGAQPGPDFGLLEIGLSVLVQIAGFSIVTALLVKAAYAVATGAPLEVGGFIRAALPRLPFVILVSIIVALLLMIGFAFLVLPGIYLFGALAVAVPAVVIERLGVGAVARSWTLTRHYRWPCVGFTLVLFLISSAFTFALQIFLQGLYLPIIGVTGAAMVMGVASAIVYPIVYIGAALLYSRLREVKEGVNLDALLNVFD